MESYIYKKIKEDTLKREGSGAQIPIYIYNELDREEKERAKDDEKRGYEELDFNIDNFIVNN